MKNKIRLIAAVVLAACAIVGTQKVNAQPGAYVSYQGFYDNLSPYGQWVNDPSYGYVWAPNYEPGFRPYYSAGHWVMTDYGNMWVSDYPWGWAPFHYGRWTYDSFYGWLWIPGNEWAPAWVSWRGSPEYYGWAPLGPGISVSFTNYHCPDDWWVFMPPGNFYAPRYENRYYGPRNPRTVINNTTIINNTYVNNNITYYTGPRRNEIEGVTHKPVTVYQVRGADKPGAVQMNKNEVSIFRPAVVKQTGNTHPVPAKAVKAERPIDKPQPVSVNGGRPARFEKAQPENNPPTKNTPSVKPVQQQPKQNIQPAQPVKKNNADQARPIPKEQAAPHINKDRQMETPPRQEQINKQRMDEQPRQKMDREPPQKQMEQPKREEEQRQPQTDQPRMNSEPQRQQMEQPKREEQNPRQMNQPDQQPHGNTSWKNQGQNSQPQFAMRNPERERSAPSTSGAQPQSERLRR